MNFARPKTIVLPDIGEIETPNNPDDWLSLVGTIATAMLQVLPTEQDHWWFLVEQFDRSQSHCTEARVIMQGSPIELHEIEYDGRLSEHSYVQAPNPGVMFLRNISSVLENSFNEKLSQIVVANVYVSYIKACRAILNNIRLKYAIHYHNNCLSSHSYGLADQWQEVIDGVQRLKR